MIKPSFKVRSSERIFITEKFICNGHWMTTTEAASNRYSAPNGLRKLLSLKPGSYTSGITGDATGGHMPNLASLVPHAREGYRPLAPEPIGVEFKGDMVATYIFETEHVGDRAPVRVGVNPDYVPILRLGHAFVKQSENAPVLVLSGETLNDDFKAIVMPMRIASKWNPA